MHRRNNPLVEIALEDRVFESFEEKPGILGFLPRYLEWIKKLAPEDGSLIDELKDSITISGIGFRLHHLAEAYDVRCWCTDQGIKLRDLGSADPRTLNLSIAEIRRFCEFGFGVELDLYYRIAKKGLGAQIPHPAFSLVIPAIEKRAADEQDAQAVMAGYYVAAMKTQRAFFPREAISVTNRDLKTAIEFFQQGGNPYQDSDAALRRAVKYLTMPREAVSQHETAIYTGR